MTENPLTARQRKVLDFIRRQVRQRGYGPTIREIAAHFAIRSPNGVQGHLRALEAKGWIHRKPHKSRTIELAAEDRSGAGLPLAGIVAAGALHEAVAQDERIEFSQLWAKQGTFVLQVRGDSMINAHISDGDYVVVQPRREPQRGDIAVVQTDDGEATLKYWFPEKNRIRLQPANPRLKPIFVRDARCLGVVVGVVRYVKPHGR